MKKDSFACFACVFFIFVHFTAVLIRGHRFKPCRGPDFFRLLYAIA